MIERAAILGDGERLEIARALGAPREPAAEIATSRSPAVTTGSEGVPFLSLEMAVARHVESALERTRGRIEGPNGAAALLRINPHTLRSRMRKLDLDWSQFRK